ncbi:hypothetical protein KY338_01595 [Candidatus Woesearchaeota archaeon]|nr:hypothetical protein [Candidatus Woesearchaeota archaeon]MBW3005607.1 hypothetical protein [Candidatus Woesearchaeota archaeon]
MEGWEERTWNDVYAEHTPIVKKALQEDELTHHVSEHPSDVVDLVVSDCADGLKKIVDDYRLTQKKGAAPGDVDWAEFVFYSLDSTKIREVLSEDPVLQEKLGDDHEMTAINCALVVSEKYAEFVNERTLATRANGYQSGE